MADKKDLYIYIDGKGLPMTTEAFFLFLHRLPDNLVKNVKERIVIKEQTRSELEYEPVTVKFIEAYDKLFDTF